MRRHARTIGAIVGLAALLATAQAQDWPQWRGPSREGKVAGFTAPQTWPKALTQKWTVPVGPGDSTPALVGDKLYVFTRQGGEELMLCLNASDGKELWRDKYEAVAATGGAARHPGPRSSPVVADGKLVVIGIGGILSCLDTSGKLLWRKDPFPKTVPTFFTAMSPVVVDGLAIAHLGGQGNGGLIAYDLATGDEKWRWAGEAPQYSSPIVATIEGVKQLITLTEKSIVGVAAADGKLLWQVPFIPQDRAYNSATPIVDGQTVYVTGAARGTKALKIEKQGDAFAAKELWSNPDVAVQFNTPVLKDGFLYGQTNRGNLFCLDAKDGKTAWLDAAQRGRGFAAILDLGSVLLALPSTSELLVLKPNPKQCEEVAKYKVSEAATYAHPVVAGNRIFIRDEKSVALWTLE
ncbi:MAG: hypothetical protein FJ290_01810 [Planctomycetes bacterium]|nr:hypothetical protein [Planctomycetota bacterium]